MVTDAKFLQIGQSVDISILSFEKDYLLHGNIDKIKEENGKVTICIKVMPVPVNIDHLNTLPVGEAKVYVSNKSIFQRIFD